MRILEKLFYALTIISILLIGVGSVIALWLNALIGFKVIATSFIWMLVALSLGIYQ